MKKLEVHIISWTGKHENAVVIANSIKCADKKIIIYSDTNEDYKIDGDFDILKTNNELYWGDKFSTSINNFESDILLIIHADCIAENWNEIVLHCKNAYQSKTNLGLWAPLTYGTAFPVEITAIDDSRDSEYPEVNYIDGIVFGLNSKIIERLKKLDYSNNIYGWGIDWFASSVSFTMGFVNIVDKTIAVKHPVERGYKSDDAKNQMKLFMKQLTIVEEKVYRDINLRVVRSRENYLEKNKKLKINLYQSLYNDDHKKHVSKRAIAIDIRAILNSQTREYELFQYIYKNHAKGNFPWGLVSWKFNLKNAIKVDEFYDFATEKLNAGADCVFINPMIGNEAIFKNVWEQGIVFHKGMKEIVDYFLTRYGENINGMMGSNNFAFCNYFIAKPIFWDKYFKFIDSEISNLNKAYLENKALQISFESKANYIGDGNLTMKPFVIERLFSLFVSLNQHNFKIVNFSYKKENYINKFGEKLGLYLWNLKIIKEIYLQTKEEKFFIQWNKLRSDVFKKGLNLIVARMDDPDVFLIQ